jgi:hypothetical protein
MRLGISTYNGSVASASPLPFPELAARVQQLIEHRYGLTVVTRDIPDPLIGDLDGAEIEIDYAVTPEQRLFLLAHLFGHTVQWNTNPEGFGMGLLLTPPVEEERLPTLMGWEREAARYGLELLHQGGIFEADQWLSDYSACDLAYLANFYRTGEKPDALTFWQANTPLLEARPIPAFTPLRRAFRREGVVI